MLLCTQVHTSSHRFELVSTFSPAVLSAAKVFLTSVDLAFVELARVTTLFLALASFDSSQPAGGGLPTFLATRLTIPRSVIVLLSLYNQTECSGREDGWSVDQVLEGFFKNVAGALETARALKKKQ